MLQERGGPWLVHDAARTGMSLVSPAGSLLALLQSHGPGCCSNARRYPEKGLKVRPVWIPKKSNKRKDFLPQS